MNEESIDVTDLEKKFLHERDLKGVYALIVSIVAIMFSTFHVVNGSFTGLLQHDIVKSIHLAFAIALSFLIFPLTKKRVEDKIPVYDFILALIGFYVAFYLAMNYREILFRAAIGFTPFDFLIAFLAVIFVLEATRRAIIPLWLWWPSHSYCMLNSVLHYQVLYPTRTTSGLRFLSTFTTPRRGYSERQ